MVDDWHTFRASLLPTRPVLACDTLIRNLAAPGRDAGIHCTVLPPFTAKGKELTFSQGEHRQYGSVW